MAPLNKLLTLVVAVAVLGRAEAGVGDPGHSQASDRGAPAVERRIEHAYVESDSAAIQAVAAELDAALARAPSDPALRYERGFAWFAAAAPLRRRRAPKAEIVAVLEQAEATLAQVHGAPWEAEAQAFRADLLGMLIALKGGLAGMTLGPKSARLLDQAAAALPNNPRVLLFQSQAAWSTPQMFGGSRIKGAALSQASVERFAAVSPAAPGPAWGRSEALRWLGIVKRDQGDVAGARAAWDQAVALDPNDGWVKFALLPSLDQKKGG